MKVLLHSGAAQGVAATYSGAVSRPPTPPEALAAPPAEAEPAERAAAPGPITLTDPRAIRALAHPARVAVLKRLYRGEVLTATECAQVAGLTPSAMSYHLRALERWGLVTPADATGDGRERPWRAAGTSIQVEAGGSTAVRASEQVLIGSLIESLRQHADVAMRHIAGRPRGERDPGGISTGRLWLTREEAEQVLDDLRQILERYEGRDRQPAAAGTSPYELWWALLPQGEEGQ